MSETDTPAGNRTTAGQQTEVETYLPGMVRVSPEPGPIEQFVTTLFRRRGKARRVVRRRNR